MKTKPCTLCSICYIVLVCAQSNSLNTLYQKQTNLLNSKVYRCSIVKRLFLCICHSFVSHKKYVSATVPLDIYCIGVSKNLFLFHLNTCCGGLRRWIIWQLYLHRPHTLYKVAVLCINTGGKTLEYADWKRIFLATFLSNKSAPLVRVMWNIGVRVDEK